MREGYSQRGRVQEPVARATRLAMGTVVGAAAGVREGLDDTIGRGKTTAILMLLGLLVFVVVGAYFPDPRLLVMDRAEKLNAKAVLAEHTPFPMPMAKEPADVYPTAMPQADVFPTAGPMLASVQSVKLRDPNPPYKAEFIAAGKEFDIPWQILAGLAQAESAFNPKAVSRDGFASRGLTQFIPATWREVTGEWGYSWDDAFDPAKNTRAAAKYLDRIRGMVAKPGQGEADIVFSMLCAFNWGAGNVTSKGADNAPAVTRAYAARILRYAGYLD